MPKIRKKGQAGAETAFITTLMVFIAVLVFLLPAMAETFPGQGLGNMFFNASVFAIGVVGTGIACASFGGIACAAGVGVFGIASYLAVPPILSVIFIPLLAVYAYILARLARGGG
jgi:type II secretory pathway component PulF